MSARVCVVLAWCALAGCIEAELVLCENGVACAPGLVCDEAHKTCVTHEQATACHANLDYEPCLDDGACHHGICVPIECGNWLRDPLEMCDDGNTISGDGCSADCTTNERCGNGVIDPARGETCDEGDLASHDGCDSQCRTEQLQYTALEQANDIALRQAAYAFDDARGKLVLFGGFDGTGTRSAATLEFDATTRAFAVRSPLIAPTPRFAASAAYDAKRHVVVLFGGSDPSGVIGDTWTWDGEKWRSTTPSTAPSPRIFGAMTYDSRRQRVLLFGGRGAQGLLDDLWAWDGTTWTELSPATRPPSRERSMFAYDPIRDRVVLFGGVANGTPYADMWMFDGNDWTSITSASLPSARFAGALTYDETHRGLVMTGGSSATPTQLWNGVEWSALGAASPMSSRVYHVAFFDPRAGAIVAGLGEIADVVRMDLHRLDGDTWTELAQAAGPDPRQEAAMTYDARRGTVVMFGGTTTAATQETWEHDGTVWTQLSPASPPSPRANAGMAYDEARGKAVLFGGVTTDADVYEWDGATWTTIVAEGPPPRGRAEMVYDPTSATTLLFGGDASGNRLGDTWQWNGTTWTEITTSPSPAPRAQHALAYDRARGEVVMFGGVDATAARLGDTWTWTASGGWIEKHPLASPSPRVRHVLAYDPIRAEVILVGGSIGGGPLGDAWSWDGTNWSRIFPDDQPGPFSEHAAVYDSARRHVLIHGPLGTHRLQWRGPTADDACTTVVDRDHDRLLGCADPDCAGYCTPLCPDATSCALDAVPSCGDGTCSPLENCRSCQRDCGFCNVRCGDGFCDGGETCSGECPS